MKSDKDPSMVAWYICLHEWLTFFILKKLNPSNNQPNRWRVHFSTICWLVGCFLIQMNPTTTNQQTTKKSSMFSPPASWRDRCDNSENWSHMFERGWKTDCLEVFLVGFNGEKRWPHVTTCHAWKAVDDFILSKGWMDMLFPYIWLGKLNSESWDMFFFYVFPKKVGYVISLFGKLVRYPCSLSCFAAISFRNTGILVDSLRTTRWCWSQCHTRAKVALRPGFYGTSGASGVGMCRTRSCEGW